MTPSPTPRHVVLITMDEMRMDALSCYGCEAIETPNLDRLAAQGTLFRNGYCASPVCLPSRYSIITGQYPHANGFYSNLTEKRMQPGTPNLYNLLRDRGYRTAHVGKCHYTGAPYHLVERKATVDAEPIKGYYMSLGMTHLDLQNDKNNSQWFWDDYSRECELAGYLEPWRNAIRYENNNQVFAFPGPAEWHPDAWVGRKAVEYVTTQEGSRPNFLWVSFSGPHYPFDPPKEYLDRVREDKIGVGHWAPDEFQTPDKVHYFKKKGLKGDECLVFGAEGAFPEERGDEYWFQLRKHYYANIVLMDDWIGKILDKVEERWGEEVLVIFTADHGETLGDHRVWGKNRTCYESVFRVPFLVRNPQANYPAESDARVQLIDILPTILEFCGFPEVAEEVECDGRPLGEWIEKGGREYVFAEQDKWIAVTDGRYKFAQCLTNGDEMRIVELYDLEADPHEFTNIAKTPDATPVVERFQGVILDFLLKGTLGRGRLCGSKPKVKG